MLGLAYGSIWHCLVVARSTAAKAETEKEKHVGQCYASHTPAPDACAVACMYAQVSPTELYVVVNAGCRDKDLEHINKHLAAWKGKVSCLVSAPVCDASQLQVCFSWLLWKPASQLPCSISLAVGPL